MIIRVSLLEADWFLKYINGDINIMGCILIGILMIWIVCYWAILKSGYSQSLIKYPIQRFSETYIPLASNILMIPLFWNCFRYFKCTEAVGNDI